MGEGPMRESGGFNEVQTMFAMSVDDAYRVERVLSRNAGCVTELVTIEGSGPFVRKRISLDQANRSVWASLAGCRCPYVPRVRATYEMPDVFVVVYDYVPGETLERMVADGGSLSASEAVRIVRTVCEAASELHARGIVHRDIAPSNVVVAEDGAHLIDLGIAQAGDERTGRDAGAHGTWGFASPEQYGFADTDMRSDVYSIGRLLGFALTGVRPDAQDYEERLADASAVPPSLRAVVERASAFEPSARYQMVDDLAQAASAALAAGSAEAACETPDSAAGAAPESPGGRERGRASGLRRFAVLIVAIVVAAVIAVVGAVLSVSEQEEKDRGASTPPAAEAEGRSDGGDSALDSGTGGEGASSLGDVAASDDELAAEAFDALEVVESGWSTDSAGLVEYAFAIRNASEDISILFPTVDIVTRDADGTVLSTDSQALPEVFAGQTVWFAGITGNGTEPSTVEFIVREPDSWNVERSADRAATFEVTGLSEHSTSFGRSAITGEVELASEGAMPEISSGQIAVTVLLRDASGSLVGGQTTFASMPSAGERVAFEVPYYGDSAYASIEAHVQPW